MRVKVELYVAGQTFTEEVRAVDYQDCLLYTSDAADD